MGLAYFRYCCSSRKALLAAFITAALSPTPIYAQDNAIHLGTGDSGKQTNRLGSSDSGDASGMQPDGHDSGYHSRNFNQRDQHFRDETAKRQQHESEQQHYRHPRHRQHDRQEYGGIKGHPSFGYSDAHERFHLRQNIIPYTGYLYRDHQDTRIIDAPGYYHQQNKLNRAPAMTGYSSPQGFVDRDENASVDPWSALADYQIHTARYAFEAQIQRSPHNALPRVGLALSSALAGDLEAGVFAMEDALRADTTTLRYFEANESLQLIIEELLMDYQGKPLMTASLHYLNRDYRAAARAVEVAENYCGNCTAVDNLSRLIEIKN